MYSDACGQCFEALSTDDQELVETLTDDTAESMAALLPAVAAPERKRNAGALFIVIAFLHVPTGEPLTMVSGGQTGERKRMAEDKLKAKLQAFADEAVRASRGNEDTALALMMKRINADPEVAALMKRLVGTELIETGLRKKLEELGLLSGSQDSIG